MTLEIVCPLCDAKPGVRCEGDRLPYPGQHAERVDAGRARSFADVAMRAGGPEPIPVDLAFTAPRRKAKAEVAIGDSVEVFVIERSPFARGASEKWLPATVCGVSRDSITVAFADHERLALPINDSGRNWRYVR